MPDETTRLPLPSGGWAEFRTVISYGARRALRRYATNIGASVSIGRGSKDVESIKIAAAELVQASEADDYFPLVHLLIAWSYDLPLPTMEDLTPLDALSWEDGEFLFEQAHKAFDNGGQVDFSPNQDPSRATPITPSKESAGPSEGGESPNGTASPRSLSSTASSG